MTTPTMQLESSPIQIEEPEDDLCHTYCAICYPADLPVGYVHFCGTPAGDTTADTPCDEECQHLMCVMCLEMFDEHHSLLHTA